MIPNDPKLLNDSRINNLTYSMDKENDHLVGK
jgi:hypothetical protein